MNPPETPERRIEREKLETFCAEMGRLIIPCLPAGVGFMMVMFDFGGEGSMAYVSNGVRRDVVTMLGELQAKIAADT